MSLYSLVLGERVRAIRSGGIDEVASDRCDWLDNFVRECFIHGGIHEIEIVSHRKVEIPQFRKMRRARCWLKTLSADLWICFVCCEDVDWQSV